SIGSIASRLGSEARVVHTSLTASLVSSTGSSGGIISSGGNISGKKLGSSCLRVLGGLVSSFDVSGTSVTGAWNDEVSMSHDGSGRTVSLCDVNLSLMSDINWSSENSPGVEVFSCVDLKTTPATVAPSSSS